MRNVAVFVILVLTHVVVSSQSPVLVDEFNDVPCEDYSSRVDNWINELANHPGQMGYATVSGPKDKLLERLVYRDWIYGQLQWRFERVSDRKKFVVVEGKDSPSMKVEFWRSKADDEILLERSEKWRLTLALAKPFEFYASSGDGGICPHIDKERVFLDLLEANPYLNGHIVFHESDRAKFSSRKSQFLQSAVKISPNRLRFFRSPNWEGHYALWLVPKKTK